MTHNPKPYFSDKKERPHWRTRVFAGEVLAQLVELCHEIKPAGERIRHFDLAAARRHHQPDQCLVNSLSDLIRCFFIAATGTKFYTFFWTKFRKWYFILHSIIS